MKINSSYIDTLMKKLFKSYSIIPFNIFKEEYDLNKDIYILKNYYLTHSEIHRLYDKERILLPQLTQCNSWLIYDNNLTPLSGTLNYPYKYAIYNEVVPNKLWLISIHTDLNNVEFHLLDIFNTVPANAYCNMNINQYVTPKLFADALIQTMKIKYKKYLERVYLSSTNSYLALKNI